MYTQSYCDIIYKSKRLELTQMSINRVPVKKKKIVHPHSRIYAALKKIMVVLIY